ncbi:Uncharacterised protein [Myroides odoratus]|nr:hypothetical protein Myrod_3355 [Myroides odoratus DSM 2801]EKB05787.1 hypothetical protein HMPREF9716_02738 [Myroides odoratus CIP 103059]STZ31465.1 Uncharacterised protein [Myroides odoratus]
MNIILFYIKNYTTSIQSLIETRIAVEIYFFNTIYKHNSKIIFK